MVAMMRAILFLVLVIVVGQLCLPTTAVAAYEHTNEDCVSECNSADGISRYLWYSYADQQTTAEATCTSLVFPRHPGPPRVV